MTQTRLCVGRRLYLGGGRLAGPAGSEACTDFRTTSSWGHQNSAGGRAVKETLTTPCARISRHVFLPTSSNTSRSRPYGNIQTVKSREHFEPRKGQISTGRVPSRSRPLEKTANACNALEPLPEPDEEPDVGDAFMGSWQMRFICV